MAGSPLLWRPSARAEATPLFIQTPNLPMQPVPTPHSPLPTPHPHYDTKAASTPTFSLFILPFSSPKALHTVSLTNPMPTVRLPLPLPLDISVAGALEIDMFADGSTKVLRHGVAAQVEFESKIRKWFITFQFQVLSSRRFQRWFDRVKLHRPTMAFFFMKWVLAAAVCGSTSGQGLNTRPLFGST